MYVSHQINRIKERAGEEPQGHAKPAQQTNDNIKHFDSPVGSARCPPLGWPWLYQTPS